VVVAVVACGAFGADDEDDVPAPGTEGGANDAPLVPDGPVPDASADGGVDACTPPCADTLVTTMAGGAIRSLACVGGNGLPVYVGLPGAVRRVDKATGVDSPAADFTARHMAIDSPLAYSSNDKVRRLVNMNTIIVVDGQDARGIEATDTFLYWSRTMPYEVRYLPKSAPMPDDAGLFFATLPELGEGMLARANTLHVAIPAKGKILTFDLDGGAPGAEIVTGDDVYAIATQGGLRLFWVAPSARKIRYAPWNKTSAIVDFVDAAATTGEMESICVDQNHVYFGVGAELHRVPLP
jgi:hypothetical protein